MAVAGSLHIVICIVEEAEVRAVYRDNQVVAAAVATLTGIWSSELLSLPLSQQRLLELDRSVSCMLPFVSASEPKLVSHAALFLANVAASAAGCNSIMRKPRAVHSVAMLLWCSEAQSARAAALVLVRILQCDGSMVSDVLGVPMLVAQLLGMLLAADTHTAMYVLGTLSVSVLLDWESN